MKAIIHRRYGPPDVLTPAEIPSPQPAVGEVLIRVRAVEVTKADCELRSFRFPVKWHWLPLRLGLGVFRPRRKVPGIYFSGVVEALGPGVERFSVDDEVFGCAGLRQGAYAEYLSLPEKYTIGAKPVRMNFEEAAAVPLGGLNALHFMRRAAIRPGEQVLVNGAGGSIGSHAVQIARDMGAEVTAVDAAHKEAMLRGIGAQRFIDYRKEHFSEEGRTYDVIFDMVAGSSYRNCLRALRPGGRYLKANPRLLDMVRSAITTRFSDKAVVIAFARETREELETLREMIDAGKIQSVVDRVLPLEQAPEAHRLVESEQRLGAIVLSIGS